MMNALDLSPDILRTISEGLDRLNDSSPDDRALADRVRLSFAQQGFLLEHDKLYPLSNSKDGYVKTHDGGSGYVWLDYVKNVWVSNDPNVTEGIQTIYFDDGCTVPIFTDYVSNRSLLSP